MDTCEQRHGWTYVNTGSHSRSCIEVSLYIGILWTFSCTQYMKLDVVVPRNNIKYKYRSGTVNSKSFVGKVLLRIKWKFELNSTL